MAEHFTEEEMAWLETLAILMNNADAEFRISIMIDVCRFLSITWHKVKQHKNFVKGFRKYILDKKYPEECEDIIAPYREQFLS